MRHRWTALAGGALHRAQYGDTDDPCIEQDQQSGEHRSRPEQRDGNRQHAEPDREPRPLALHEGQAKECEQRHRDELPEVDGVRGVVRALGEQAGDRDDDQRRVRDQQHDEDQGRHAAPRSRVEG
jgi:hypothetical protein